jgi:two-component system, OmpR family, sensor kinase
VPKATLKLPRFGLLWRMYLLGLVQIATFVTVIILLIRSTVPNFERQANTFGEDVARAFALTIGTPSEQRDRSLLRAAGPIPIAVFDASNTLLLAEGQRTLSPVVPNDEALRDYTHFGRAGPLANTMGGTVPVKLADGRKVYAVYALPGPTPPSISKGVLFALAALLLVGLASFLAARTLSQPLTLLSRAARKVGDGHFETRVNLNRNDELGEVGRAFDEMTARVERWIHTERELMANVSHELRTPLSRIRVAVEMAEEGDLEQSRRSLATVGEDLRELDELIENLLTAGRLDLAKERHVQNFSRLSMTALLEQTLFRFRQAHPTRTLQQELPDDGPFLNGDAALLKRAINNLLANAHHYSEPGEEISVRGSQVGDTFVLQISDKGVGISAADLPRLFTPFFRADSSRNRQTGGVGLGLLLTKRIVEAHQGEISVESQVGMGTVVTVKLKIHN